VCIFGVSKKRLRPSKASDRENGVFFFLFV